MDQYMKANQAHWDELVAAHVASPFYDLEGFRAGNLSLLDLERRELGDVSDKSLLHLQCHFGLGTLSWARLGAHVTGVDFAPRAISTARQLSQELGLEAEFVCCDVYDLPDHLTGRFDIVFTSYGVLTWLPDLTRWAEVVAHFVKPGGLFYIAEIHPFAAVFDDDDGVTDLRVHYPYFHSPTPLRFADNDSYAAAQAVTDNVETFEWTHGLGDIVNALIGAGLRISFLHEFPYACYKMFPFMEQDEDGWWRMKGFHRLVPLTFSILATAPEEGQ